MCELCLHTPCDPKCPNYSSPIDTHVRCDKCGEMIEVGDEYLENINGNAAHLDCFYSIENLLDWLDEDIKVMEKENIDWR